MPQHSLTLADGSAWVIDGGDKQASAVVLRLGEAMQLGSPRQAVRRLYVVSDEQPDQSTDSTCILGKDEGPAELFAHLLQVSLSIVRGVQKSGSGVLLHGALAEWQGQGIIMIAPGGIGKTTASNRLPPPWRSLSDDATLVVRDEEAAYWAHPWPTWSRFLPDGPGGSWNVERAVPLKGIFVLSRAAEERAESIGEAEAAIHLAASADQSCTLMMRGVGAEERRAIRLERLDILSALARSVPVYILHLSLTGPFWQEIEQILEKEV